MELQVGTRLPRTARGPRGRAAAYDAAGLLVTALTGAALVHVLAYHVPSDSPFSAAWVPNALGLFARCPLTAWLALVGVVAILSSCVMWRELRRLQRVTVALSGQIAPSLPSRRRALDPKRPGEALIRSPWRLIVFIALLLCLQAPLFILMGTLCPMQSTMVMNGTPMTMAMSPALPLGPLHLLVATVLALLLWRLEHRLSGLQAEVARLRLFRGFHMATPAAPAPWHMSHLPLGWHGSALFANPPPAMHIG